MHRPRSIISTHASAAWKRSFLTLKACAFGFWSYPDVSRRLT
jgi:hypothetical protein